MHKILIVGHPQSDLQEVDRLLRTWGMAPARPSRRECFTPQQISATLTQAHALAGPTDPDQQGDEPLQQVTPGTVWQGLALDLLLGNMDHPLWGWTDAAALPWLNFWRDMDPALHFVLVYDHPHSVLTRAAPQDALQTDAHALARRLRHWENYNAALLRFFRRNPQRCLLVHSARMHEAPPVSLQTLRARFPALWRDGMPRLPAQHADIGAVQPSPAPEHRLPRRADEHAAIEEALTRWVAHALLRQNGAVASLFDELQAHAQLPGHPNHTVEDEASLASEVWSALQAQRRRSEETHAQLQRLSAARKEATRYTDQLQQEASQLRRQAEAARQRQARHAADSLETLNSLADSARREHQRLELALAQAQSERDALAEATQRTIDAAKAEAEEARLALQAQQREREKDRAQATEPRLGIRPVVPAAPAPALARLQEENHWLLESLMRLQLEFEAGAHQAAGAEHAATPVVRPSATDELFGAADRVREELRYRLGALLIRHGRHVSGWWRLPGELVREFWHQAWRHRQRRASPPLHAYRDAQEGERLKRHLSYRLGDVLVRHLSHPLGWLRVPFAMVREVRSFRERQRMAHLMD